MDALYNGEKILYNGRPSWRSYLFLNVIAGVLTFGIALVLTVPYSFISIMSYKFVVTHKHVYSIYGLLSRQIKDAPLSKIQDTSVYQSFAGRLLGYGDLLFNTAGGEGYEIKFCSIEHPLKVRNMMRHP